MSGSEKFQAAKLISIHNSLSIWERNSHVRHGCFMCLIRMQLRPAIANFSVRSTFWGRIIGIVEKRSRQISRNACSCTLFKFGQNNVVMENVEYMRHKVMGWLFLEVLLVLRVSYISLFTRTLLAYQCGTNQIQFLENSASDEIWTLSAKFCQTRVDESA